jgi:hypothetical protein
VRPEIIFLASVVAFALLTMVVYRASFAGGSTG